MSLSSVQRKRKVASVSTKARFPLIRYDFGHHTLFFFNGATFPLAQFRQFAALAIVQVDLKAYYLLHPLRIAPHYALLRRLHQRLLDHELPPRTPKTAQDFVWIISRAPPIIRSIWTSLTTPSFPSLGVAARVKAHIQSARRERREQMKKSIKK